MVDKGIRNLYIVCHNFYDREGKERAIGGVETYVEALGLLGLRLGWQVTIFQFANRRFERIVEHGFKLVSWVNLYEMQRILANSTETSPGLVIYSDYGCIPKKMVHPCIVLQHGVGWDYSATIVKNVLLRKLNICRKLIKRTFLFKIIRRMTVEADRVLCVDTNFGNWLSAKYPFNEWRDKLVYIPNFAAIPDDNMVNERWNNSNNKIRCIFPRRFAIIRGAVVFAEIVRRIHDQFTNVTFAFVGDGACEPQIRSILSDCDRVEIYRKPYQEMVGEFLKAHIAVIPTLAAEGTSLSCIEAMAAGCAVLATTVGGLGNLIIPDFNGIICQPTRDHIERSLKHLLTNISEIRRLGQNAHKVAQASFSKESWELRVERLIEEVLEQRIR